MGLAAYIAGAVIRWLFYCSSNGYFRQGLWTLALFELISWLNRYALVFGAGASLVLVGIFLARLARAWLAGALVKFEVVNRRRLDALSMSLAFVIFAAGLAALISFEASPAPASLAQRSLSNVVRGLISIFSPSRGLRGFVLRMGLHGVVAALITGAGSVLLALRRPLSPEGRPRAWAESSPLRAVGAGLLVLLASLNAWGWWNTRRSAGHGPNIILISIDALRADHLEAYGYPRKTAPNIESLAAAGVVFSNAYAQASWTLPSMGSLFTGLYPSQHGAVEFNTGIRDGLTTLAEALKNSSYLTIGITTAWFMTRTHGFAQGFDIFDQSQIAGADSVTSPEITELAVRYLRRIREKKFFLWLHYYDTHAKYIRHPGHGYADGYRGLLPSILEPAHLERIKDRLSAEDRQYVRDVYDEEIVFTDASIGRLLHTLKELGLAGRTEIIVTADHGEELLDRSRYGHGSRLYQELIRVPLVIAGPGVAPTRRVDEPVELRSIGRTILNLCQARGLPFPGVDLLAPRESAQGQGGNLVYSEGSYAMGSDGRREAAIGADWKLIHNLDDGSYELYDLREDRLEKRNLFSAGSGEQQRIGASLAAELAKFHVGTWSPAAPAAMSQEEITRLKSLGYIQ